MSPTTQMQGHAGTNRQTLTQNKQNKRGLHGMSTVMDIMTDWAACHSLKNDCNSFHLAFSSVQGSRLTVTAGRLTNNLSWTVTVIILHFFTFLFGTVLQRLSTITASFLHLGLLIFIVAASGNSVCQLDQTKPAAA